MKHYLTLVIFSILISGVLHSQVSSGPIEVLKRKNAIYVEFLGNGGIISYNYDRIIYSREGSHLALRLGGTEWHEEETDELNIGIVTEVSAFGGGPRHHFDLGLGVTYWTINSGIFLVPRLGYRYVGKHGLFFRASPAMVIINSKKDSFGGYWIAVAGGFAF